MLDPSKIAEMMQQAQQMQSKMQNELSELRVLGQAGGGMVKVNVDGNHNCLSVEIDEAVVDKADISMLQDLIQAAINDAARRVEEKRMEQARSAAGNMGIPGLF